MRNEGLYECLDTGKLLTGMQVELVFSKRYLSRFKIDEPLNILCFTRPILFKLILFHAILIETLNVSLWTCNTIALKPSINSNLSKLF